MRDISFKKVNIIHYALKKEMMMMMTGKNEGSVKVRKKYFFNKHYAHLKIYKYMSLSAYVQIKFFTKISWAMALMSLFLEKKKKRN